MCMDGWTAGHSAEYKEAYMAFKGSPGISRLAAVIDSRVRQGGEAPLALDFGEIQKDLSLVSNTFPVPVPKGDYSVLGHLAPETISPGSRVLVAWVQSDAVVIGDVKGT